MTSTQFRRMALSLPEAAERSHFDHPDFRVSGKIFATLGYPRAGWGMVNLTPQRQNDLIRAYPNAFSPVKGTWGVRGATLVRLRTVKASVLREAIIAAWRKAAPRKLQEQVDVQ